MNMSGSKTLLIWANSLKMCATCLSLSLLVACQYGQVAPSQPEQSPDRALCECETAEVEETPPVIVPPLPSCPEIVEQKKPVTVAPPPTPVKKKPVVAKKVLINDKLVIGRVENVLFVPDQLKLKARIDTGAGLSSIHGIDITDFERDGQSWVRFAMLTPKTEKKIFLERPVKRYKNIKQFGRKNQQRPVVLMSLKLGSIEEQVEMTVTDRTGYIYQVLIGRNFLRDRAIVDVSDTFVAKINTK
jgi:hypothetical protein